MKLYYWNTIPNFGDLLSGLLLQRFAALNSIWSPPQQAQLVICGSILEHLPVDYSGYIAGAGYLHSSTKHEFPNAKIVALRGPLSAVDFTGSIVLGDPGLLADELVPLRDKEYELGILPHWTDHTLQHNPLFKKYSPLIIHPTQHPLSVIANIGKCKKLVTSSLHGIILADAFGIPRRTEVSPRALTHPQQEGDLFKFKDYNASINLPFIIGQTQEANRNTIIDKQHELFDMFTYLKTLFTNEHI